ncbi:MAG TPA: sulfatase [Candidatus Omnitrophota bacterium]|nr:sulfatase [Candidatus Omnitrophota bacterium]
MKNKFWVIAAAGCFLSLGGLVAPLQAQHEEPVNVLLITVDSLRPDHLGCYGYPKNISPNIDKLAKEGVIFTQAIAQASWTLPSIVSIATSTYPSAHKVNFWGIILSPKLPTIAEILRRRGYHNFLCSGHSNPLFEIGGFQRGFDDWTKNVKALTGNEVSGQALRFLKENYKNKFFLWVHYMDTHDHFFKPQRNNPDPLDVSQKQANIVKYDNAIKQVDQQIGIMVDELNKLGIGNNTLIIITADHGEEICEHGRCFAHAGSLWDPLIRVPLIMVWGKQFPGGLKRNSQVQHIDIAPTICDVLKIKKPALFKGQSLLPIIQKEAGTLRAAFSEYHKRTGAIRTGEWLYSMYSVRMDSWKLIYTDYAKDPAEYALYNLKADPEELKNLNEFETLRKNEEAKFRLLRLELETWSKRKKPQIKPVSKQLDKQTKERLKSLGYLH